MALEVYQQGSPRYVAIFDAKYKWHQEKDGTYHPKYKDINTMRMYRDLIQYQIYDQKRKQTRWQQIISSAYILYPGGSLVRDPGNVIGALPMIPDMPKSVKQAVEQAITTILRMARLF